jgi:hypothetical protein
MHAQAEHNLSHEAHDGADPSRGLGVASEAAA